MESREYPAASGGLGFFGALGILFIALKLTHVIHWPWVFVLMPIWVPAALAISLMLLFVIVILICELAD